MSMLIQEKNFPAYIRAQAIMAIETSLLHEIREKEVRMKNAIAARQRQLQSQNELRIRK